MEKLLKTWLIKKFGITVNDFPKNPIINPDIRPRMDYRLVFGSIAMVRNPDDIDYDGTMIWKGPVEIIGCDNNRHTYMTSFGDFCYARLLTEDEKDFHAKSWKHTLAIKS